MIQSDPKKIYSKAEPEDVCGNRSTEECSQFKNCTDCVLSIKRDFFSLALLEATNYEKELTKSEKKDFTVQECKELAVYKIAERYKNKVFSKKDEK